MGRFGENSRAGRVVPGALAVLVGAVVLYREGAAFEWPVFLLGFVGGTLLVRLIEWVHGVRGRGILLFLAIAGASWVGGLASQQFGPAVGAGLVGLGVGAVALAGWRRVSGSFPRESAA